MLSTKALGAIVGVGKLLREEEQRRCEVDESIRTLCLRSGDRVFASLKLLEAAKGHIKKALRVLDTRRCGKKKRRIQHGPRGGGQSPFTLLKDADVPTPSAFPAARSRKGKGRIDGGIMLGCARKRWRSCVCAILTGKGGLARDERVVVCWEGDRGGAR